MGCSACGDEKPKDIASGFPGAVVEINNPEALVLLRKVVIPASMGDDSDVPATVGKYRNVVLHYESNNHTYIYSSDGIPTLLEMDIPQEVLDRITTLEEGLETETETRETADQDLQENIDAVAQDLEDFKNSPDVVDIVATYADLQAYDTSELGDKDEIRVLADETHDGASAYYQWDKDTGTWTFIGITGPYYTKSEIDTTVDGLEADIDAAEQAIIDNLGKAKTLTADEWDYPEDNPLGFRLKNLAPGLYEFETKNGATPRIYYGDNYFASIQAKDVLLKKGGDTGNGTDGVLFSGGVVEDTSPAITTLRDARVSREYAVLQSSSVIDSLTRTDKTKPLSADQGRILNNNIGNLSTLTTTAKTSTVDAINELDADMPSVVQTTGTSTTDVMSQNAVTSMVFADPASRQKIQIGNSAFTDGYYSISIGTSTYSNDIDQISLGRNAGSGSSGQGRLCLGSNSVATGDGAIALGTKSKATAKGEMNIGTIDSFYGYNSSNYRLITGVYDPQSDHDAATKGYVDTAVSGAATSTISSTDWSALWQ